MSMVVIVAMANIHDTAVEMFSEWKITVFYRKMSIEEYDIRREAVNELFRRNGRPEPRPVGWRKLYYRLKEKDPDLVIPKKAGKRVWRGKY